MEKLFTDTSPEAEAVLVALWRQMPVCRKLAIMCQLNMTVRTLAISGLRQRYPDADQWEIRRRLADLTLGPTLAAQVYGPLPEEQETDERRSGRSYTVDYPNS